MTKAANNKPSPIKRERARKREEIGRRRAFLKATRQEQPIFYKPAILGFLPYQPRKATQRILDDVGEVLDAYADNLPLTLRQVYYRLVATHDHYPKSDAFYQKLSTILSRARRAGLIDWDAIRDDGVTERSCGGGYSGLGQFKRTILQSAEYYTLIEQASQCTC